MNFWRQACHQSVTPGTHDGTMHTPYTILNLLDQRGGLAYEGEGISQIEHAWQCGQLAAQAATPAALQLAAWLHDLGHLLTDLPGSPTLRGLDDRHEYTAAALLQTLWGPSVADPVRLHVQAKRYLVATHPGYAQSLSPDSVRSLALQGGPMTREECRTFAHMPYAREAQQLRSWDDQGKRAGWFAPGPQQALDELAALMARVVP